ncbi:MAG: right-handed parallel beta-helix repeat-containing protein, partial [Planctomycetota bacterium]
MRTTFGLIVSLALAILVLSSARGEEKSEPIVLEKPAGMSDAVWKRIREGVTGKKEVFLQFLELIERNRIDEVNDSPHTVGLKRQRIQQIVAEFTRRLFTSRKANPLFVMNIIHFQNKASPRLSGRVVHAGPGGDHKTLHDALIRSQPGDLIILEEGNHSSSWGQAWEAYARTTTLKDVAILGPGSGKVTISIMFDRADRVRLEGVTIDCRNMPFLDLRRGGSFHLKNCHIFNYNSGAGGSNAINARNSTFLVEDCTFEGMTGRVAGRTPGGGAFDLRGDSLLYVRKSRFIDNTDIVRATFPCTFDECESRQTGRAIGIIPLSPGTVFLRKNKVMMMRREPVVEFHHATDEPAFLKFLLTGHGEIGPRAKGLAKELDLHRNLPFWIGLVRHESLEVRRLACERIEALTGKAITPEERYQTASAREIASWIRDL